MCRVFSNGFLLQFGSYNSGSATPINWPTTFSKVYMSIGYGSGNYSTGFYAHLLPHTLTTTGFSHYKTGNYNISYIAIGKLS